MPMKSNCMLRPSPSAPPKNSFCCGYGQVHLAEQGGVAEAAGDEVAHVLEVGLRVEGVRFGPRVGVGGEEEGHGVDAEARDTELEPVAEGARDLLLHGRVGDVEVGLGAVEVVEVVLAGLLVELPDAVLLVGEDDLGLARSWLGGRPHVVAAVGVVDAAPGLLEPRVLVGGVVHDEVDDHPDAARPRGAHELDEVARGAQARVDAEEVGDVVAVVAPGGRVERHEPQAGDAEVGEVLHALGHAPQVADAVAVAVLEGLDVGAVEHGRLPPHVAGLAQPHRVASSRSRAGRSVVAGAGAVGASWGSTRSPKVSRKASWRWPTWCR